MVNSVKNRLHKFWHSQTYKDHFIRTGIRSHYYILCVPEKIEKVQKRATKLVQSCKGLAYSERLRVLGIPTLKYRWHRGDMIETYKIFVVYPLLVTGRRALVIPSRQSVFIHTLSVTLFRCLPHPNPMFPLGPVRRIVAGVYWTGDRDYCCYQSSPTHRPYWGA